MALAKAVAVGLAAAVIMPAFLRDEPGLIGRLARAGAIYVAEGGISFWLSVPMLLAVTAFAWLFFGWADR